MPEGPVVVRQLPRCAKLLAAVLPLGLYLLEILQLGSRVAIIDHSIGICSTWWSVEPTVLPQFVCRVVVGWNTWAMVFKSSSI